MELFELLEKMERRIDIASAALDGMLMVSGDCPTYNGAYYAFEDVRDMFKELEGALRESKCPLKPTPRKQTKKMAS